MVAILDSAPHIDAKNQSRILNRLAQAGIINVTCLQLATEDELRAIGGFRRNGVFASQLLDWMQSKDIETLPHARQRRGQMRELGAKIRFLPTDFMLFLGVITPYQRTVLCHQLAPTYGSFSKLTIEELRYGSRLDPASLWRIQAELEKYDIRFKQ